MSNDPQQNWKMKQIALNRFYGLVAAVLVLTVVALIWIANVPGLQDPATGRLPAGALRALIIVPVGMYIAITLVLMLNRRR